MIDANVSIVQYEDQEPETRHYIVKKIPSGEVLLVPSVSSIYILKLEKGQMLILIQPPGHPEGYLVPPI